MTIGLVGWGWSALNWMLWLQIKQNMQCYCSGKVGRLLIWGWIIKMCCPWKQCVYLSSPVSFIFFFFLFSVHMLSKCCHAWGALDFGFCGGFISFFFSLCYQLNWLNRLYRKCTEIVQCSQIRWQQILVKWHCSFLSLGKSGLVCLQLHINSRLTWQFLWDCHKQPLNSRWKVEIPSCNWWGDYSYCL